MLRSTIYGQFFLFLILWTAGVGTLWGQSQNPLRSLYSSAYNYADRALSRGEDLVMVQCDIISRSNEDGGEIALSLVHFKEGLDYNFRVETNDDIRWMQVYVFDVDSEDSLGYGYVEANKTEFTVTGDDNFGAIGFIIGEFSDDDTYAGAYSLVITSTKSKGRPNRPDKNNTAQSNRPDRPNRLTPVGGSKDCDMSKIEKGTFQTEFRTVENMRTDDRNRTIFQSTIKVNLSQNEIIQKPKKGNKVKFTIIEKSCIDRSAYEFKVVDQLGRYYVMTLDLAYRNETLTIAPEDSYRIETYTLTDL